MANQARVPIQSLVEEILKKIAPDRVLPAWWDTPEASELDRVILSGVGVHVLGLGKPAVALTSALCQELENRYGDQARLRSVLVVTKRGHGGPVPTRAPYRCLEASHPVSDESSFVAGEAVRDFVEKLPEEDLLLVILSGGASALAPLPNSPFTRADKVSLNRQLLRKDLSIIEINRLRTELSLIKGGGLVRLAGTRRIFTLIASDVPVEDPRWVASGPTFLRERAPEKVRALLPVLDAGLARKVSRWLDSAERGSHQDALESAFSAKTVRNHVVCDGRTLLDAAQAVLTEHGYVVSRVASDPISLSLDEGLKLHQDTLRTALSALPGENDSAAVISAGEMTFDVRGGGRGGRCTEFVVRMAEALFGRNVLGLAPEDLGRIRILGLATDGTDGPTDAAGGWMTLKAYESALQEGLDPRGAIAKSDTLTWLEQLGSALRTGPTGANLMDINACIYE